MAIPKKILDLTKALHKEVGKTNGKVIMVGTVTNVEDGKSMNMVCGTPLVLMNLLHSLANQIKMSIFTEMLNRKELPEEVKAIAQAALDKMAAEDDKLRAEIKEDIAIDGELKSASKDKLTENESAVPDDKKTRH